MTSENISSTVPRRQLGRYLREGREAMGMTLDQAAELMQWGKSTLQRLERGNSDRIRDVDIKELCRIYGFDEDRTIALVGLARQAAVKSWWHEFGDIIPENFSVYVGLEGSAQTLTTYQPDLVPGLLQTPNYARALAQTSRPNDTDEDREGRIALKMRRQTLITRKRNPTDLEVILGEGILRRVVGGPKVMAAQLRYLADAGSRPNITIRIMPFSAGLPTGELISTFTILEFGADARGKPTEPTIVYAENFTGDMYSEKPAVIQRYMQAYDRFRQSALNETSSKALLRQMAREHEKSER